jgi:hypothetical protein
MTAVLENTDMLPDICGCEDILCKKTVSDSSRVRIKPSGRIDFGSVRSAFSMALHMHQPLIPAGGDDLCTADIISNLQYMMKNPGIGDNHNAPVFLQCYKRMGEFIPQLIHEGKQPRIMLEYSGTLLHGLSRMGRDDIIETLKTVTINPDYRHAVEWLGCPWAHAVAPSTPIPDYRLHVDAWKHHFSSLFGMEALERVRGFSPSEMALPNHPDAAYEFVKTLRNTAYEWVMVQEHTVEIPATGAGPLHKHLPHRMTCTNSHGESVSIIAIIKTQGSDTKLVAQGQPYYEAKGLSPVSLAGRQVPQLVTQIADGENGGVMMNEFPSKYFEIVRECSGGVTPMINVSEYLDHLFSTGITENDLPVLQPVFQKKIWDRIRPGEGPEKLSRAIEECKREDSNFNMDGGSWTNNISWVRGYENVLGPIEKVSALFHEKVAQKKFPPDDPGYRKALFYLLLSQTSCFRYWGQGVWTDYAKEICRRAADIFDNIS